MNIVFRDTKGNILLKTPSFASVIEAENMDPEIDAKEVLFCLFLEEEHWVKDELCAFASDRFDIFPNRKEDINQSGDEFEISQDEGDSIFVYIEDDIGRKINFERLEDELLGYDHDMRDIPGIPVFAPNAPPKGKIFIEKPIKPFKG